MPSRAEIPPGADRPLRVSALLLTVCLIAACGQRPKRSGMLQAAASGSLRVSSKAFQPGSEIPSQYTCSGRDISPPLAWTAAPSRTKSLALIVDDPDAPGKTWVHWVAYNLPADLRSLPEAVPKGPEVTGGGRQGRNDFGDLGYGGPCPPPGKAHDYHFKVYALDRKLELKSGARKQEVVEAMRGHILSTGELIAIFKR
jgi:Raf kinase inhibitor-like YbhB/YbcL family protein